MLIAYDAKRAFHNQRGLGNYSRDVIRLMRCYAPENEYLLCDPMGDVKPRGVWRWAKGLWRSWGISRQLNSMEVAIYHGLSGELPIGLKGCRTVVTMHDAIFMRYPQLYSATYRWLFSKKVAYACRRADIILCISEQTKRDMVSYFGADERKLRVVYQGCHKQFREPVDERDIARVRASYALVRPYIIQVGAIEERKNLKTLIEGVGKSGLDCMVVAVGGRTGYAQECAELAQALGVELRMLSGVPMTDLPALYKGAVVSAYPSIFEGFGIPIVEAMCVGVPVLTSTGSCFAETGGDAARYIDPTDSDGWAAALKEVMADEGIRSEMIRRGHVQAERFTDEAVQRGLMQIYNELV